MRTRPLLLFGALIGTFLVAASQAYEGAQTRQLGDRTQLDLGTVNEARDRVRAQLLNQLLTQMSIDAHLSVSDTDRLQLLLPTRDNPIKPDRPQTAQVVALLATPWQVDIRELRITTLGSLLARIRDERGQLRPWHCVLVERSLAKPLSRRLCRDRTGTVSLAATLLPNGQTRDWEVITQGEEPGALEFYAFDPLGRRTLTADFGGMEAERRLPAPQSCAACHLDTTQEAFKRWPTFADASVWTEPDPAVP